MNKYSIRYIVYFIVVAAIFLYAYYPYWLFGAYSAIGWYDEYHAIIPWYFARQSAINITDFLHGYAGGTSAAHGFGYANETISFYRILITHLELWQAQFLFRMLGLVALFGGVFLFARKIFENTELESLLIALFASLVTYIPAGWTIGGLGWDLAAVVWLCFIMFFRVGNVYQQLISIFLISFVVAVTCAPNFLLPLFFYMIGFCVLTFSNRCRFSYWVPITAIVFLLIMVINWWDAQYSVFSAKGFSARINGVLTADPLADINTKTEVIFYLIKIQWEWLVFFFTRSPNQYLLVGYFVVVLLTAVTKQYRRFLIFVLFAILLPLFLDSVSRVFEVPLFSKYRWSILFFLQSIMIALYLAHILAIVKKSTPQDLSSKLVIAIIRFLKKITFVLLSLSILVSANVLARLTLDRMSSDGSLASLSDYDVFKRFQKSKNKYRFVSTDFKVPGVLPIFYNLDTFDGMVTNFPYRRNYFIAYSVYDPSKDYLHTHRHFFTSIPNNIDINMLKMANVKYVISSTRITHSELEEVAYFSGMKLNDTNYLLKSLLEKKFEDINALNPIFIYELKNVWPRVFGASTVATNNYSFKEHQFYIYLKKIQRYQILIAKEDSNGIDARWFNNELKIKDFSIFQNSIVVNISKGNGVLVFNQVYTKYWEAYCADKKLQIIPANGVMMSAYIPEGCKTVLLQYTLNPNDSHL